MSDQLGANDDNIESPLVMDGQIPVSDVADEGTLLSQLIQHLSQRPKHSMLLSDLGVVLPEALRHRLKDHGGLRCWLQRYPTLFSVVGQPGKESVTLILGARAQQQPTSQAEQPAQQPVVTPQASPLLTVQNKPQPENIAGAGNEPDAAAGHAVGHSRSAAAGFEGQLDEDPESLAAVQLRGLPYKATVEDVRDFLGEKFCAHLTPMTSESGEYPQTAIHLVTNRDGRPSGFARVQFDTPEVAVCCREERHYQTMDERYVEVFLYSERPGKLRSERAPKRGDEVAPGAGDVGGGVRAPGTADAAAGVTREMVVQELRSEMCQPNKGSILLSMLGASLSPGARAYLKQTDQGLKHFLAQLPPKEFSIDGHKGRECVVYTPVLSLSKALECLPEGPMQDMSSVEKQPSRFTPWDVGEATYTGQDYGFQAAEYETAPGYCAVDDPTPTAAAPASAPATVIREPVDLTSLTASPTRPGGGGGTDSLPFPDTPTPWSTPAGHPREVTLAGATSNPFAGFNVSWAGAPQPPVDWNLAGGLAAALAGVGTTQAATGPAAADAAKGPMPWVMPQMPPMWGAPMWPMDGGCADPNAAAAFQVAAHAAAAAASAVSLGAKPAATAAAVAAATDAPASSAFQAQVAGAFAAVGGSGGAPVGSAIRLRGLPFSSNEQDILAFFAQYDIVDRISDCAKAVTIILRPNGRSSGQAVVQMRDKRDAKIAQEVLGGKWMGSRYIEVFPHDDDAAAGAGSGAAAADAGNGGTRGAAGFGTGARSEAAAATAPSATDAAVQAQQMAAFGAQLGMPPAWAMGAMGSMGAMSAMPGWPQAAAGAVAEAPAGPGHPPTSGGGAESWEAMFQFIANANDANRTTPAVGADAAAAGGSYLGGFNMAAI